MGGPSFMNPGSDGVHQYDSPRWGPDQVAYGGAHIPDGFGHGHYDPNSGFNRPPGQNLLGWTAIHGASGQKGAGLG
jgi:hypothetical protein